MVTITPITSTRERDQQVDAAEFFLHSLPETFDRGKIGAISRNSNRAASLRLNPSNNRVNCRCIAAAHRDLYAVSCQAPAPYSAAKAGVLMFSRNLANDVAKQGIRVNCISPAAVLTDRMRRQLSEEQQRDIAAMHPLGRMGTPEDIASAALFLASDSSSWITGVTLDVAGGRVMI
jgi:NAD(P)-dependent dehydrogenase (short-subunit alcohol dehydrogenase family)